MNSAFKRFDSGGLWSFLEMLELKARSFMGATVELRQLQNNIVNITDKNVVVTEDDRRTFLRPHAAIMIEALKSIGASSALASANRLNAAINDQANQITYNNVADLLRDIESRFADHLDDIKMVVLNQSDTMLMKGADSLIELDNFSSSFPNASFEIEEACKCIALQRYTAAVFHSMRTLEIGIRALAKRLGIPDPTNANERNWGIILGAIKTKIDNTWPKKIRFPNTEGAKFDALYVTLDAVKNPWRNTTMHVETIYVQHEAIHIVRCSAYFMRDLFKLSDENGVEPILPVS